VDSTPNLGLPYIMAAQSQKHVTHNEAIRALDAIVQLSVLDRHLGTPPGSPAEGARYIVAASPTGAWSGHAGEVAAYQDGAWMFYAPAEGWIAWIADEDIAVVWSGSAWVSLATGEGGGGGGEGDFATLGINATADTTNRLAVAADATLLNHDGDGHQLKINKAAADDTASLLYQTAFSGRAELGLAGDDDFHFKVSADGATWKEAIVIDRATGEVSLPFTSIGGGEGGAPTDAEYIVKAASSGLSAERVLTDTATVAWDYATGGAAKASVPDAAITYAKLQNVSATDKLLGRASAGAGAVEEIACTAFARSLLDDADAGAARTTLGVAIGSNVQAFSAGLGQIAALAPADGEAIVWDGIAGAWVAAAVEGGGGGEGGGAPTGAEYIVKASSAGLSAERVLTDTASLAWDYGAGGQAKAHVVGYDELLLSHALLCLQVADLANTASFTSANRVADSFDALTYVDVAGATNLDTGTAGVLKPSVATTTVTINNQDTTTNFGSVNTLIDLSTAIVNGRVITALEAYSASARNITLKIALRNSAGNFTVPVSQTLAHPGGGWATLTLTSAYTVPGSGSYYLGATTSASDSAKASIARAVLAGDAGSSASYSEDTGSVIPTRYVYQTGVNNLTVRSAAHTAAAAPAAMKAVMRVKEVDAATAGSDYTLEFSRDNGTTWTAATLTELFTAPGSIRIVETNLVDVTGQPSGTSLRWRFKTLNNDMVELNDALLYWQ
jgi:hypothetical protein